MSLLYFCIFKFIKQYKNLKSWQRRLSESLAKLAEKTKSLEEKFLKARTDSKEKLTKRIEESKADLQLKKDNFISHADQVNAQAESELNSFQTSIRQKGEHLKAEAQVKREQIHEKREQKKHERNIASAERHYNTSLDICGVFH